MSQTCYAVKGADPNEKRKRKRRARQRVQREEEFSNVGLNDAANPVGCGRPSKNSAPICYTARGATKIYCLVHNDILFEHLCC